jgi:predicted Zn-dependent protease
LLQAITKMKKTQLILSTIGIVLVGIIYFGAKTYTKNPKKAPTASRDAKPDEHEGHNDQITEISFEEIKSQAYGAINASQKQAIQALEGKNDSKSLFALSALWAEAKQGNLAAKYKADEAKLEKSEKSLTFASQYFIDLFNLETNPSLKKWQATQAIELLEMVQTKNPKNENAKIALASCYTDGTGETMKGVQLLLGVVRENPANIDAGIILGRMAVQSSQFDKAITRLEDLLKIAPKNTEAMYHLAQAYKGKGDVAKSKELLNTCKTLVNKPEFSKEIDEYIKTF